LVSVEAVDNFSRPLKTTVVNRAIPTAYALNANYPNPFNPTTNISFALPIDSKVSLKIYNIAGQLVRTLVNETMVAGTHTVTWDGINSNGEKVASGIYFYKLNAGDYSKTMKMVMTK
ncbi:MAG: T9SS type A sorting domain-containing protein, partial [candidate division Zixibacteria bacterium]|nr:T9SS type A sorting domain-containing protein [candidate division Zixibacteria bacterium]